MSTTATVTKAAALLLAASLPSAAVADSRHYCTLSNASGGMPAEYGIQYSGSSAVVSFNQSDGPGNYRMRVTARGDQVRLNFRGEANPGNGDPVILIDYSMVHQLDTGAFSVNAARVGTTETFSGSGSCAES